MLLTISLDNLSLKIPSDLSLTRRDVLQVDVRFLAASKVVELPPGFSGTIGIKQKGRSVFLALSSSWTQTGVGDSALYSFDLSLDTKELADAMVSGSVSTLLEVQWWDGKHRYSSSSPVVITECVITGEELSPSSYPDLKATQADASSGVSNTLWMTPLRTFQAIASWVSENLSLSWNAITGKPETFPPDEHGHEISQVSGLQTALDGKQPAGDYQPAGSYATLVNGTVPAAQLPSFVDDVLEFASFSAFPQSGETGKIYVAIDTGKVFRWSGSTYVEIVASPGSTDAVPEGQIHLYFTDERAAAAAPVQVWGEITSILGVTCGVLGDPTYGSNLAVAYADTAFTSQDTTWAQFAQWAATAGFSGNAQYADSASRADYLNPYIPGNLGGNATVYGDGSIVGPGWSLGADGGASFANGNVIAGDYLLSVGGGAWRFGSDGGGGWANQLSMFMADGSLRLGSDAPGSSPWFANYATYISPDGSASFMGGNVSIGNDELYLLHVTGGVGIAGPLDVWGSINSNYPAQFDGLFVGWNGTYNSQFAVNPGGDLSTPGTASFANGLATIGADGGASFAGTITSHGQEVLTPLTAPVQVDPFGMLFSPGSFGGNLRVQNANDALWSDASNYAVSASEAGYANYADFADRANYADFADRAISADSLTGTVPSTQVTGLSTVAASGSYNDLSNKPALGTAATQDVSAFDVAGAASAAQSAAISAAALDASSKANSAQAYAVQRKNHTGTQPASTITGLAAVATSGSFNDLSNAPTANQQLFTASGTWTKPAGAKVINIQLLGGGGGGASGRRDTTASVVRCGGGGGGGGGYVNITLPASLFNSTETVTIGAGGAGGAGVTAATAVGNGGVTGGSTIFGSVVAPGGFRGTGGSDTNGFGGAGPLNSNSGGAAASTGGNGGSGNPANTNFAAYNGGAGGGAGGGVSAGGAQYTGGAGGRSQMLDLAGGAFGTSTQNGSNGLDNTLAIYGLIASGSGGGGGGGAASVNAGNGGNGGYPAAGGGGGGATFNGTSSGAGGNGANGIALITTYF